MPDKAAVLCRSRRLNSSSESFCPAVANALESTKMRARPSRMSYSQRSRRSLSLGLPCKYVMREPSGDICNPAMVGPANVDPAQQVKLLEDLIAKKVSVIGLVPLDVKVCEPVLKRAQAAGIKVITHEGPEQEGRDWNVELIDSVRFGEVQMQRLAKDMGEEGDYVVYVGTLTTPLHNKWADAAIAYQKAHYPKMKLVADRFPGADEIDTSYKTTLDVIKAYPNLKGILGFGSNGPIGAGNAVREKRLGKKIAIVGTVLPSQAKDLIMDGIIREGFLWNPTDAGYAMIAVGRLVLDGKEIKDGIEIPGLGKATVDVPGKLIKVDKIMQINTGTIDGLIAGGL